MTKSLPKADKNKNLITSTGRILKPISDNNTLVKLVASLSDVIKIAIYEDCAINNKPLPESEYIMQLTNYLLEMIYDNWNFGK